MQIVRSNDVFLGLPHNIVQFTTLQEVLAGWLGADIGTYNQISDSLHIYDRDLSNVLNPHTRSSSSNSDSFALPKDESEQRFRELAAKIEYLTRNDLRVDDLGQLANWRNAPIAFSNSLFVLIAEAARRRSWFKQMDWAISECTNPVFIELWTNWLCRMSTTFVRI